MEIEPAPAPRRLSPRARTLLAVAIFAPVTVLALLPTMLGLERFVVASGSMGGGIDKGSVVFERVVPVGDLQVGDVITYRAPPSAGPDGELITHRIIWIEGAHLQTQGDARDEADPWLVPLEQPTMSRVVLDIPYVGYPFVAPIGQAVWLLVLMVPGSLLGLMLVRDGFRARHVRSTSSHHVGTFVG